MEYDRTPSTIRDSLCPDSFVMKDGRLSVPEGAGLGIEIDEGALSRLSI